MSTEAAKPPPQADVSIESVLGVQQHNFWQRIAAAQWTSMLDVAAGTGDIALRVVQALGDTRGRNCIVSDLCPAMLEIAERRAGPLSNQMQFKV